MPYSVQSYSDVGGSPFQQYQNQQFQNYLQQQQAQHQNQQSQFGQQMPGMQPNSSPYNQQQYGQLPQYNPLPQYNFNQNSPGYGPPQSVSFGGPNPTNKIPGVNWPQDQGTNFSRGFGGVETPNPIQGMYQSPQPSQAGAGFVPKGTGGQIDSDYNYINGVWTQPQPNRPTYGPGGSNPYPTNSNLYGQYPGTKITPGAGTYSPQMYNPLPSYSPFQYGSPSGGTGNFFQY